MLDDRLLSAGVALREAPVPDVGLDRLALRRRRRTARRAGLVVVLALVLVAGALARREPASVRVVDDDVVRVPVPDDRLVAPTATPAGWRIAGIGGGGTDLPPDPVVVYAQTASDAFTRSPYVAIVDQRSHHLPRTAFGVDTGPTGLRSAPIAAPDRTDLVGTVYGWHVTDAELQRIAAGVRVERGRLVATHVPHRMRPVPLGQADPSGQRNRSVTFESAGSKVVVTNVNAVGGRLARYAWLHPGAIPVRRGGRRVLEVARPATATWMWLQHGRFVTLELRPKADERRDPVHADPTVLEPFARAMRLTSAQRIMPLPGLGYEVTVVDDTVDGVHRRVTANVATRDDGQRVACFLGIHCTAPPPVDAIASWSRSADAAVFAVGGRVASVALHYGSGPTRLVTPVRIDPQLPRVAAAVAPAHLRRVEALDRRGRVLGVLRY